MVRMDGWLSSLLVYILITVGILTISIIALYKLVFKRRESPKLKRLVELRLQILSDEKHGLSYVEHDEKGQHIGTLNLPSKTNVPLLIWYAPRLNFPEGAVPKITVEPMESMKLGGLTPELDSDEGVAPEIAEEPMKLIKPKIYSGDAVREVLSGSYHPTTVDELLSKISEEKWRELQRKLRELMDSDQRRLRNVLVRG